MNWESFIDTNKSIKKRKLTFTTTVFDKIMNNGFPILIALVIILLSVGIFDIINENQSTENILTLILIDLALIVFFVFYIKKLAQINDFKSIAIKREKRIEQHEIMELLDNLGWTIIITKDPLIYARNYRGVISGGQEIAIFHLDNEILFNSTSVPVTSTHIGYIRFPISVWSNQENFRIFENGINDLINEK